MKVLIVAKTRQRSGACIGGITFEGRSVRLIAADAEWNEHVGLEYRVGEVWDVDAVPAPHVIPPHVENMVVRKQRRLGPMTDPVPFIERHMGPRVGGPEALYEGLLQTSPQGALYIVEHTGIPPYSTTFWRPDQDLVRSDDSVRLRYCYPAPDGWRSLTFVGFQEPPPVIPAGTLVRVSLAHWWRPRDRQEEELRCYAQLSGYFADQPVEWQAWQPTAATGDGEPGAKPLAPRARKGLAVDPATVDLAEARSLLKSVFGHDDFWPLQAEVIANVLARRDTMAVMPTGGGKSLCYQLPALLLDGLTLVVSPLIALMQDQVDQLLQLGVPAVFLNSSLSYPDYARMMDRVRRGEVKLLYTSPETLQRPETLVLLDRSRVACLVIDEAHCISSWGHDFRPEYRQLLPIRERYSKAVCLALTATATRRVQQDVMEILGFQEDNVFVASFNRPNLYLEVEPRLDGLQQVLQFLEGRRNQSGIIYCATRAQVDELSAQLVAHGWSALPYHAGLDDATRQKHQRQFVRDQAAIIVATIAFGMGINKSNVRFILHYNLPKNLEQYYQEIGRAGRDGLPADCLLLFNAQDAFIIQRFIEQGAESERAGRQARLQALVRFVQAQECRRVPLLRYFGEEFTGPCSICDQCQAGVQDEERHDVTEAAHKFLTCVKDTGQMFGVTHIVDVLRGSRSQRVLKRRHDRLSTYGQGRELSASQWRGLAQQLISQGLLDQSMEHGGVRLTPSGREVLRGARVTAARRPQERPKAVKEVQYDADLFEHLRALRRQLADEADVPAFVVFSDRSLAEMCTYFPHTPEAFVEIDGVGRRKLERYGNVFLEVIRAYCAEHGLKPRPKLRLRREARGSGGRSREVGRLFATGHSLEELQTMYGVQRSTIVNHLCRYVQDGGSVDPERLLAASQLSAVDRQRVLEAFAHVGHEYLNPVFQALDQRVPYEELHLMRAVYLASSREKKQEPVRA